MSGHGFERGGSGGGAVLPDGEVSTFEGPFPSTFPDVLASPGVLDAGSLSPWAEGIRSALARGDLPFAGEPGGVPSLPWWKITCKFSSGCSY